MTILLKILIFVVAIGLGIAFMKYNYQLTQFFGYNSLAERYLGDGGTYTMWRLLGLVVIAGAVWWVFS